MEELIAYFEDKFNLKEQKPNIYSPLVLAYIGDAVYDLIIRTIVVNKGNAPVNKMHNKAREYVKASAQASMYYKIQDILTEEEVAVFKRGRNAKSGTVAKNASIRDYKNATGLEALIGYLYLKKDYRRIIDLISEGVKDDKAN